MSRAPQKHELGTPTNLWKAKRHCMPVGRADKLRTAVSRALGDLQQSPRRAPERCSATADVYQRTVRGGQRDKKKTYLAVEFPSLDMMTPP